MIILKAHSISKNLAYKKYLELVQAGDRYYVGVELNNYSDEDFENVRFDYNVRVFSTEDNARRYFDQLVSETVE